jgi:hypothetical protein
MEEKELRRNKIVEKAVTAADRIIIEESDGSIEEINYLTAMVAKKFIEKALLPFQQEILKKDIGEEETERKAEQCRHVYPDVIRVRDEKRKSGEYVRILDCKYCGRYERPMNPEQYSSELIRELDEKGVVIGVREEEINEYRQKEQERLKRLSRKI